MKFLRVLCVLCGLLVQVRAIDREAFTFTNYDLDVRIEPEQQRLAVRGKIILRNDSVAPQKNLPLQISSSLGWRSIELGGKPAQFVSQPYTSDIDHTGALSEAIVTLPNEIPPKGAVELEIGYEGIIPLDATRLTRIGVPAELARHSDWDQIGQSFTAVRGIGYVAWYPIATESANLSEGNSVFERVARWKAREVAAQLRVKLSDSGEGAANLLCNSKTGGAHANGRTDSTDESVNECSFQPLGATVPLLVVGKVDGLQAPSSHVSYIPDHKPGAEKYMAVVRLAIPFVAGWIGYPKERIGMKTEVVELGDPEAAPYESGSILLTPLDADSKLMQLTAVHQLAHAAFSSPRLWIYEGLAHLVQAAYLEQGSGGRQSALDFIGLHRTALAEAEKALDRERSQNTGADESLISTSIEDLYRSKALYVWWMLRDIVGDDALKKALAAYRPDADTTPSYMQQLIEAQTKSDLGWFFDDWVYRDRGLPDFKVATVYPWETSGNAHVVTVTVENLGNAAAEVPLILKMEEGQVTKRILVRGKSKAIIRIEAISTPREIVVNDGSVPESDMSNNVYKMEAPAKKN